MLLIQYTVSGTGVTRRSQPKDHFIANYVVIYLRSLGLMCHKFIKCAMTETTMVVYVENSITPNVCRIIPIVHITGMLWAIIMYDGHLEIHNSWHNTTLIGVNIHIIRPSPDRVAFRLILANLADYKRRSTDKDAIVTLDTLIHASDTLTINNA